MLLGSPKNKRAPKGSPPNKPDPKRRQEKSSHFIESDSDSDEEEDQLNTNNDFDELSSDNTSDDDSVDSAATQYKKKETTEEEGENMDMDMDEGEWQFKDNDLAESDEEMEDIDDTSIPILKGNTQSNENRNESERDNQNEVLETSDEDNYYEDQVSAEVIQNKPDTPQKIDLKMPSGKMEETQLGTQGEVPQQQCTSMIDSISSSAKIAATKTLQTVLVNLQQSKNLRRLESPRKQGQNKASKKRTQKSGNKMAIQKGQQTLSFKPASNKDGESNNKAKNTSNPDKLNVASASKVEVNKPSNENGQGDSAQNNVVQEQDKKVSANSSKSVRFQHGTKEDDINTTNSDNTSVFTSPSEMNRILAPINLRMQIIFTLDSLESSQLLETVEEPSSTSTTNQQQQSRQETNLSRIRAPIQAMYAFLKTKHPETRFLRWSDNKDFATLPNEEEQIPTDLATLSLYFDGIRPKQSYGRVYIRFRVHHNDVHMIGTELESWAFSKGYQISRCLIQSENSSPIGWLLYSSQYTDTETLCQKLFRMTGFEWGMRIGAVSKADSSKQFKDRVKAQIIYVPTECDMIASAKASMIFSSTVQKEVLQPEDKYIFVHQENRLTDRRSKEAFVTFVNRQEVHLDNLMAMPANIFEKPIDQLFRTNSGVKVTLQEIVLNINNYDKKSIGFNAPLFHAIDFTEDSSKLYFNNRKGPGGASFVFSFYEYNQCEATAMIQGLGKYVSRRHGKRLALKAFTMSHWNGNVGWKWHEKVNKFTTPEATRLSSNLESDRNQIMVRLALKKNNTSVPNQNNQSEQVAQAQAANTTSEVTNQEDNESTQSTTISQIAKEKAAGNVRRAMDPDLDSVASKDGQVKKVISDVVTDTDAVSTTSSITMGTAYSQNTKSALSTDTELDVETDLSEVEGTSITSIGTKQIKKLLANTSSAATKRDLITKKFQEHIAKAIAMQQKVLDSIAIEESPDPQSTNTTSDDLSPDPTKSPSDKNLNNNSSLHNQQTSQAPNNPNNEGQNNKESPPPTGSDNSRDQV